MATLFTSELEEGMVTLTDTYSNSGKLIVPKDTVLTKSIIQMLSGNLGHSHNTIHRCTDIVRHARQKQAFRAVGMLRRIVRFLHGLLQLLTSASCVMNVL